MGTDSANKRYNAELSRWVDSEALDSADDGTLPEGCDELAPFGEAEIKKVEALLSRRKN